MAKEKYKLTTTRDGDEVNHSYEGVQAGIRFSPSSWTAEIMEHHHEELLRTITSLHAVETTFIGERRD